MVCSHIFQQEAGTVQSPIRLLILFCCFFAEIRAQNYLPIARHFGIEDGLPHRQVNCILEDQRGFIWVATNGGVARFDGLRFKIFNKADNGLSTDFIHWMLEDATGNLWLISLANGKEFHSIATIDILNPISGQVTPHDQYVGGKPPLPLENFNLYGIRLNANPWSYAAQPGTLLFGTHNPGGWISWHPDAGWTQLVSPSLSNLTVLSATAQGGVLGYTTDGFPEGILVETDKQGTPLRSFQGDPGNYFALKCGSSQSRGQLFALESMKTTGQIHVWEIRPGEDKKRVPLQLPGNHPPVETWGLLLRLEKTGLWVSEFGVFNQTGTLLLDLRAQFPKFNDRALNFNLCDRNGDIWLSTSFGLEHIQIQKDRFRRFLFDEKAVNVRGISCRGILQQGGNLWVNVESPEPSRRGINLSTGHEFFGQNIGTGYGLAADEAGYLWGGQTGFISNQYSSLTLGDQASGKALRTFSLNAMAPWCIFPANPSQLWVGTETGLVLINPQTGHLSQPDYRQFPELEKASIIYIGHEDKKNRNTIWICSNAGFYKMNANGQILERYWSGGKGDNWLPYDNFYHFHKDWEGVFWLGTGGCGLLRWNPGSKNEKHLFSRKNGLLNSVIYAVYEDDFGHLWMPTDYGIAQFDKKNQSVRRTWLPSDGLAQYEFNRTSHYRGDDGTLYFGGLNGITAFHPKDFYGSSREQHTEGGMSLGKKLVLADYKLFSGTSDKLESRTEALLASGEIQIMPSDRYFQLEFALLDYSSPEKVTYFYKIEGLDADWTMLNEPLLRLSSLPFGSHRLKIRAQSADGIRAANELDFSLRILPPFYLRWWFLLLATGVLTGGGYFFYRFQLGKRLAEKEAQRLHELDNFKSRLFTNITHEFRTPLTVILGITDQESSSGEPESKDRIQAKFGLIGRNGKRLLRLVNQILDLAKIESNSFQFSNVQGDVLPYLRYLTESLQSLANAQEVQLVMECSDAAIVMDYDPERLLQIVHNLLSNAVKFTPPGGKVTLQAAYIAPNASPFAPLAAFKIQVSDTGVGISPEDLPFIFDRFYQARHLDKAPSGGTGIGLALTKELVQLMGGTITVHSEPGKGSAFTASWPITHHAPMRAAIESMKTEPPGLTSGQPAQQPLHLEPDLPSLLIIEDNLDVIEYLSICLQGKYHLDFAYNGRLGIEKALETVPDLIISDVMMPEKDGFEVCARLKNDIRTSHIPILLLTAKTAVESRIAGLKSGADAYLAKPFHQQELLLTMRNLMALRNALQARFGREHLVGIVAETSGTHSTDVANIFEMEDAFVQKLRQYITENMGNSDLSMEEISRAMTMSYQTLHRKITALTNLSPVQFIRLMRLSKARTLLQTTNRSISEISFEVGFNDAKYFSRVFTEEFGQPPSSMRT